MNTFLIIAAIVLTPVFLYIMAAVGITIYLLKMSRQVQPICAEERICVKRDSAYWRIVKLYYDVFGNYEEKIGWEKKANLCPTTRKFFWGVMAYPFVMGYRKVVKIINKPLNVDQEKLDRTILKGCVRKENITPLNITTMSVFSIVFVTLLMNFVIVTFFTVRHGVNGAMALPIWQNVIALIAIIVFPILIYKKVKKIDINFDWDRKEVKAKHPGIEKTKEILGLVGLIILVILIHLFEFVLKIIVWLVKMISEIIAEVTNDLRKELTGIFKPITDPIDRFFNKIGNFFRKIGDFFSAVWDIITWEIPHDFAYKGKSVIWGKAEDTFMDEDIPAWLVIFFSIIWALWVQGTISFITGIIYLNYEWETWPMAFSIFVDFLILWGILGSIRDARKGKKKPSLLMSWLKARHDKVCPPLEFVGEPRQEKS